MKKSDSFPKLGPSSVKSCPSTMPGICFKFAVKIHNLKAVLAFIDFKHAFDSAHRGRMLQILRVYHIPEKQIDAIGLLYRGKKARVMRPDGETDFFEIQAGILQGDALAPYIFAIVLDYAIRRGIDGREEKLGFKIDRRRGSRHHQIVVITDTDFADDIAITSDEIHQAQEMLASVETEAAKIGLHLNSKKTEVMHFNQGGVTTIKAKNGEKIKTVDSFEYLGGWLESFAKEILKSERLWHGQLVTG